MRYLILLTFLMGCSSAEIEKAEVEIVQKGETVIVSNKSNQSISLLLVERNTAAATNFRSPCEEFSPNLKPLEEQTISLDEVMGYDDNAQSIWYSWTDCETNGDSGYIEINNLGSVK